MSPQRPAPVGRAWTYVPGFIRMAACVTATLGFTAVLAIAADYWRWPLFHSWGMVHGSAILVIVPVFVVLGVVTGWHMAQVVLAGIWIVIALGALAVGGEPVLACLAAIPAGLFVLLRVFSYQVQVPSERDA